MSSSPLILEAAPAHASRRSIRDTISLLLELSKARLCSLVGMTAAIGYVLASAGTPHWGHFAVTLAGTMLLAFGANALNQCWEHDRDARMQRTCGRPLPAGQLSPGLAWTFGVVVGLVGAVLLVASANMLTAMLGVLCLLLYVLVYTPMKVHTPANTILGAVTGALPPMMGVTAVTGQLDATAWVLGGILFVWQLPHFLALAWLYRADYERGGFRMLPSIDPYGRWTTRAIVLSSLALMPVTLALTVVGAVGWIYAVGAFLGAIAMTALGIQMHHARTDRNAKRVFLASVLYLPVLMILMVADRTPPAAPEPFGESAAVSYVLLADHTRVPITSPGE